MNVRVECSFTVFLLCKLEKNVVDAEIEVMRELGVDIKCGVEVGKDISLDELRAQGAIRHFILQSAAREAAKQAFRARMPRV